MWGGRREPRVRAASELSFIAREARRQRARIKCTKSFQIKFSLMTHVRSFTAHALDQASLLDLEGVPSRHSRRQ